MLKAIKFLSGIVTTSHHTTKTSAFQIGNKVYKARHIKHKNSSKCSTILLFGGFSVYGSSDKRLLQLANSFANAHFRVLIFEIPHIEKLEIHENIIVEIKTIIKYVAENTDYTYQGNLSIAAPSFSAAAVLGACKDVQIQKYIKSILTIGTFSSLQNIIPYIISSNTIDDYARNILLKNFIEYSSIKNNEDLKNIIWAAVSDNGYKRKMPKLNMQISRANNEARNFWNQWCNSEEFRILFMEEIYAKNPSVKELYKIFDIIHDVHHIQVPLFLLHGQNDEVVPSSESKLIYDKRNKINMNTIMCITPLLDHGDANIHFSKLHEIVKLQVFFQKFFKNAK